MLLKPTSSPFSVAAVAPLLDHVTSTDDPESILAGLTVIKQVGPSGGGGGGSSSTTTVTGHVLCPPGPTTKK